MSGPHFAYQIGCQCARCAKLRDMALIAFFEDYEDADAAFEDRADDARGDGAREEWGMC